MGELDRDKPLVLLADDDEMQRYLTETALDEGGFSVVTVLDGAPAIEQAERLGPDIILLDVLMPHMSGFDACMKIRNLPDCKDTPIIMITGADDTDAIEQAYESGATDFMPKPLNWTILCHRLRYIHRASKAFGELQAVKRLRNSEARLAEAQRLAQLGNWEWDLHQDSFYCSDEARRILALDPDIWAPRMIDFLGRIHPQDRARVGGVLTDAVKTRRGFGVDCRLLLSDGSQRIVAVRANLESGDEAKKSLLRGTCQDITERKQLEQKLQHLAYHDTLTNLPNRRLFEDRLAHAIAQAERDDSMLAVVCLDVDHFKEINDTLGHAMGDRLLQEIAGRIKGEIRAADTLARLGGDEFAIIQSQYQQPTNAEALSSRLLESMSKPFNLDGREVLTSLSIGIALYPTDAADAEQLIVNADIALFRAKAEGRGKFCCFETEMEKHLKARKAMRQDLRRGMENGWFELHYQPQLSVESGAVVGVEALLRLRHPQKGLLLPGAFISVAEETGLVGSIGEWVLQEACAQAASWQRQGRQPIRMSVNLSPVQLRRSDIAEQVAAALKASGLEPALLELEITETALVTDAATALARLEQIRALGVRIAMDDFGTGYSSLSCLKQFPLDRIKLDRSFIQTLESDREAAAIVRSVISLGHDLNLRVTAEGVESAGQYDALRNHGCDEVQGFYFGRPVPAHELFAPKDRTSVAAA